MLGCDGIRAAGVRACRRDLLRNGIDVASLGERALSELVREQLDYFQLMLGGEPGAGEVVALIRRDLVADGGRRPQPGNRHSAGRARPGPRAHLRRGGVTLAAR